MVNHSFMERNMELLKKYSKFNHTIYAQKWKQKYYQKIYNIPITNMSKNTMIIYNINIYN